MSRPRPASGLRLLALTLAASAAALGATSAAAAPPAAPGKPAEPRSGQLGPAEAEEAVEAVGATEPGAPEERVPWRGSSIGYRNIASITTFDKGADLTWNPYYAMGLSFEPRYWPTGVVFLDARFDLTRELTDSDVTTFDGETVVGDLTLGVGASRFLVVPGLDVGVSASLQFLLPTSKVSQARTLNVGVTPGLSLSRVFPVLEGLSLAYGARVSKLFHDYTTSSLDTPLISGCIGGACGTYLNTGVRNTEWRMTHSFGVSLAATEWLSFDASAATITDWLYPIGDAADDRVSLVPQEPTDTRHLLAWGLEGAVKPARALTVAIGASTIHPELAPDSSRYAAFVNRYTNVYLDLRLDVAGLYLTLTEDASSEATAHTLPDPSHLSVEARR